MSEQSVVEIFDRCNAIWLHDGDVTKPHAKLTTDKCSNGYFNCSEVLKHPWICRNLASQLYFEVKEKILLPAHRIDWVIGSPYAAITFSYEFASILGAKHGFTKKDPKDPEGKKMIWDSGEISEDETILQVEELITTSWTFFEVRRAVGFANPDRNLKFLPFIPCIVHRPQKLPVSYVGGIEIISLIEREIWSADPEDCPLCKAGSKPLRPKSNWAELTGKK